jgi:hypothetical protein
MTTVKPATIVLFLLGASLSGLCFSAPALSEREARRMVDAEAEITSRPLRLPVGRYAVSEQTEGNVAVDWNGKTIKRDAGKLDELSYLAEVGVVRLEVISGSGSGSSAVASSSLIEITATAKGQKMLQVANEAGKREHIAYPTCTVNPVRVAQIYMEDKGPESYAAVYWTQTSNCTAEWTAYLKRFGYVASNEIQQCSALSTYDKFNSKWGGLRWMMCSEPGKPLSNDHVKRILSKK